MSINRLFHRPQAELDLHAELQDYIEHETQRHIAAGIPEAQARSKALLGIEQAKEECRDIRRGAWFDKLAQDVRYGWRTMLKNPLFSAMAILSLALGIGANTAIYSLMDAIMVRALPVQNAQQLVILNWRASTKHDPDVVQSHSGSKYTEPDGGSTSPDLPWPAYESLRARNHVLSSLFAFKTAGRLNVVLHGQAEIGEVNFVSGNYFTGLGIGPAAGRLINDADDRANAPQVAVISYRYWQERLAGAPAAVGESLTINNIPFTIAGVAPPEFLGVSPAHLPVAYIPLANRPVLGRNYGDEQKTIFTDAHNYWIDVMGRLRPGVTLPQAQAELSTQFQQFALSSATTKEEKATLPKLWVQEGGSGVDSLRRQYSTPLFVLMTMVAFILTIACANIANLLLARATARRREIAVRLSLGAGRLRVVRQLLTESLMLAFPGALLGLGVAVLGIRFLTWLLAGERGEVLPNVGLDWRVLLFTLGVAFATGILFGLAPAIAATRVDFTPALKESRASASRRGRGKRVGLSQLLLISQIALSLLLVLGAAIFVRTLANLHSVNLGFNKTNLLTFRLDASQAGYQDAALRALYQDLRQRFSVIPGVQSATMSDLVLISQSNRQTGVVLPGAPKDPGRNGPSTSFASVGPAFFETLQLPMLLGRTINSHDVDSAPHVAVVNQVFANKYFPNQDPIGRQFSLGNSQTGDLTIVGVAKNAHYSSLKEQTPPVAYIPFLQHITDAPPFGITFELRTLGNPISAANAVRQIVHQTVPRVPVTQVMTHAQQIDNTIVQERTFADLCTAFAILALAIACVGLYGTMAYSVARRTNEIGIRMALGAERREIVWLVQREVLLLATAGLCVGMLCAWATMSSIKSFLFGMKPGDPLALSLAAAILITAAILAGLAPALRASRIDPLNALRHE